MKPSLCCLRSLATLGLAARGLSAFAQPTPAAFTQDSVVTLNAFEVPSSALTGYVASESTTGTRVATKIADLPFVVNVVTSQFLNDFDFFDIAAGLGYTSSLSSVDTEGNFNLRGFPATFYSWNGFYRLGLVDRVNIDRIEIIKGPSAAIYGQTSPAGLLDIISKTPSPTAFEDIKFTAGSFDTQRVEGHVNSGVGTIGSVKVSNLLSFDGYDSGSVVPYFSQHQRADSDSLKFEFNDHSSLIVEGDWYKNLSNTADAEQLLDTDPTGKTFTGNLAPIATARFSQGGPNERQNREFTNFYTEFENRFNDIFSLRIGGYDYDRHNSEIFNGISVEWSQDLGDVVGISTKPTRIILDEDGGAGQADLLAHYYLFHHLIESKTLLTLDWSENWRYRHETEVPTNVNTFATVQNFSSPNYGGVPDYSAFTVVSRNDKVRWDTNGVFLRDQITMFDGRLLLFGGIRKDQVTYNLNFGNQYSNKPPFSISNAGQVQHFVNAATTPATGLNFKLTSNIALYANYSQSFEPSAQAAKLGDPPLGNTRGFGEDYGIKANFMDSRLVFTLGGYYVTENGIKISVQDPVTGVTDTVAGGSQNSKGVEFDATYQVADSLSILWGAGLIDARLIKEGTVAGPTPGSIINNPEDGRRPPKIPVDNAYVAVRYDFGRIGLPGLAFHGGLKYVGVSYPESTASSAAEAAIRLPAYWTIDTGITYSWTTSTFAKFKHTVGFSVDNLTNADYVKESLSAGNSRGFFFSYQLKH